MLADNEKRFVGGLFLGAAIVIVYVLGRIASKIDKIIEILEKIQ